MKRIILNVLASILMAVAFVACNGGGSSSSNSTLVNLTPKLSEEQRTFCEYYFMAIQVQPKNVNKAISLFELLKSKGYSDIIHAFSIPELKTSEEVSIYVDSALKELGLDHSYFYAFYYSYSPYSSLKQPELKATFVEKLDNGTKIWLIEDYQSMQQARLLVKENGEMNIGNLESFSNY